MLVEASFKFHPSDELLEEYSFGRVREPTLTSLEEHLLACHQCLEKMEDIEVWRAGVATFKPAGFRHLSRYVTGPFTLSHIGSGTALLACGVGLAIVSTLAVRSARREVAAPVQLTALRGGEDVGNSVGPANRPLDLYMSAVTVPSSPAYRVEVVNLAGRSVWAGAATIQGESLSARISPNPGSGLYWVRLYGERQLLREFGLRLK